MHSALTKEELMEWRRSTEKITLEEFAARIGKMASMKKETNDLHDLLLKKEEEPPVVVVAEEPKPVREAKPDIEVKIEFDKKLNKREELVFEYLCKNRNQKVMVKDIAQLLELPNDYVYKYIKNLRSKLSNTSLLENADQGGYVLHV